MTIRVTRYGSSGQVFHTCDTEGPVEVIQDDETKAIFIAMPMRFWRMVPGGKVEIEANER